MAGGDLTRHIPMGTTAVVAIVRGDRVHIVSLGDSRAYLVGATGAALLTADQNLRGEWLRSWQNNQPFDHSTKAMRWWAMRVISMKKANQVPYPPFIVN